MLYKLEFEVVPAVGKGSQFYYGDNPVCNPEFVPDEFWVKTSRETDNPWQQYNTLKQWAETGTQLIRNVKLFEMSGNPQWVESRPTPRALDECPSCDGEGTGFSEGESWTCSVCDGTGMRQ